jgi:uncharacterized protein YxjI
MLEESVEVMRELWTGRNVNHRGPHHTVSGARIYTRPEHPPPVYLSAFGPKAARTAGGEGKPCQLGTKVCFGTDEAAARRTAHRLWPNIGLPGEQTQGVAEASLTHPLSVAPLWDSVPADNRHEKGRAVVTAPNIQALRQLIVRQRIRLMVNQYEIRAANPDGSEGELLAFAQQKRLAFKEQVTLYSDDTKQRPVLGFKARQVLDLGATYDVFDAAGQPVGLFKKDFGKSLFRSTWHVEQPGLGTATGQERSMLVSILRRFVDSLSWLPYDFDFTFDGQQPAFSVVKKWGLRDRYVVDIHDPRIDRRLVIAMAVALDALQAR